MTIDISHIYYISNQKRYHYQKNVKKTIKRSKFGKGPKEKSNNAILVLKKLNNLSNTKNELQILA